MSFGSCETTQSDCVQPEGAPVVSPTSKVVPLTECDIAEAPHIASEEVASIQTEGSTVVDETPSPQGIPIPQNSKVYSEFHGMPTSAGRKPVQFPLPEVGNHWQSCHQIVEQYDAALCDGWNDDINTLLVFVGLFTAAVTAFTIESYKRLERDPAETANVLLLHITRQLAGEDKAPMSLPSEFVPSSSDRRINIFWFLSLIVALMTALLGILCKQWLREYQKDAALSSRDSLGLRQLRFHSFVFWRVEDLISALPLFLQLTMLLFVLGILDLLWHCDTITAAIITVAAVLGIGAIIGTTILPVAVLLKNRTRPGYEDIPPCAFESPQAMLCLRLVLFILKFPRSFALSWSHLEKTQSLRVREARDFWTYLAVYWIDEQFPLNPNIKINVARCLSELSPLGHPDIFDTEDHRQSGGVHIRLDEDSLSHHPGNIDTYGKSQWPNLTTRILFHYMIDKVPLTLEAMDSDLLAAFRRSFSELTLLLVCLSPTFLERLLESDSQSDYPQLNLVCPTALADLYAGPLYLRRPDVASKSFMFAVVGPTIRFFLEFFRDPGWNVRSPVRIHNRSECHVELASNMLDWVDRMPTSDWIQIRYCVLDSVGEDVALTSDAITGAVGKWADRSQSLGFPTFKDFFTIVEFLDRTRSDGCNGRELEWTVLVNIVRSELERLQSQYGYFS
ncbi:hypothetical protein BDZ89DRAFT_1018659 [Hymenopellis radicata]|nr:hypothetical protein BDZ89DRAFT_1018659 [Hymenopellis radicata]